VNLAIIGCGLIGQKRANALGTAQLVACVDISRERAERLAKNTVGCVAFSNWRVVMDRPDIMAVIVSTPPHLQAEIVAAAIESGKDVLVEKPAARSVDELQALRMAAENKNVLVRVGFNHRFHRAFRKARTIVDSGALGDLMFLRTRYGHGGRLGYDNEWRAIPEISGGGELIDQGVHIIDLARWFLGDFTEISGYAHTYFWNMPVDDNAFLLLRTSDDQVAFLHASCTEWKNTFSFELYGRTGKLQIDGLGGSYGVERLAWFNMLPTMGPPETTIWEYPMADDSWDVEMRLFLADVQLRRQPRPGLSDAIAALDIVQKIYSSSGHGNRS